MKEVAELSVVLDGLNPKIYRKLAAPFDLTLHQLHLIIQAAVGWQDKHRYFFEVAGERFEGPGERIFERSRDHSAYSASLPYLVAR
jgi:hypothetical protein